MQLLPVGYPPHDNRLELTVRRCYLLLSHVGKDVWVAVDLESPEFVSRLVVQSFWDGNRYYQYTIDGSLDGEDWSEIVDFSRNTSPATIDGYIHAIDSIEVRFLQINLLYNSANPGLHLVEFSAFH